MIDRIQGASGGPFPGFSRRNRSCPSSSAWTLQQTPASEHASSPTLQAHYTPTEAGLHSLMQSAAIALGRHAIRCNSLLPGTILTEINKEDLADEAKRRYMEGRVPLGRLGVPEDMVGPAVFLASDMARYVTGAALLVDGGAFVNLQ